MNIRDVPYKKRFRLLVDLEDGERLDQLPIYEKVKLDWRLKAACGALIPVIQIGTDCVELLNYNAEVEILEN